MTDESLCGGGGGAYRGRRGEGLDGTIIYGVGMVR